MGCAHSTENVGRSHGTAGRNNFSNRRMEVVGAAITHQTRGGSKLETQATRDLGSQTHPNALSGFFDGDEDGGDIEATPTEAELEEELECLAAALRQRTEAHQQNDDECPICYEPLWPKASTNSDGEEDELEADAPRTEVVELLPCGHQFCAGCIAKHCEAPIGKRPKKLVCPLDRSLVRCVVPKGDGAGSFVSQTEQQFAGLETSGQECVDPLEIVGTHIANGGRRGGTTDSVVVSPTADVIPIGEGGESPLSAQESPTARRGSMVNFPVAGSPMWGGSGEGSPTGSPTGSPRGLQRRTSLADILSASNVKMAIPGGETTQSRLASAYFTLGNRLVLGEKKQRVSLVPIDTAAKFGTEAAAPINANQVMLRDGRVLSKQELYIQAIKHNPSFATAYFNLGNTIRGGGTTRLADGRHVTDIDAYLMAVTHSPSMGEAYTNIGVAMENGQVITLPDGRRMSQKVELYIEAIKQNRDCAPAYTNVGALLVGQGESVTLQDGRVLTRHRSFVEAIRCNPQFPAAYYNLGNTLMPGSVATLMDGRKVTQQECYLEVLRINKSFPDALASLKATMSPGQSIQLPDGRMLSCNRDP